MLIDSYLLSNAQRNNIVSGINLNNLNKSQTSLDKNILPSNRSIIKKEDINLDFNILKDKFGCKFLSGQKIFLF